MKIRYLGHSCFVLTSGTGTRIVTDPYGGIGFSLPRNLQADAVTVSHGHHDHSNPGAVGGDPAVFDREGSYAFGGVGMSAVKCFHDGEGGRLRGGNLIFKFRMDGLNVCHLGDLGERCSAALVGAILPVDVLLIPVGGVYTVDAEQAKEYVDRLKPSVVIPMHYFVRGLNLAIGGVDKFVRLFEGSAAKVEELGGSDLELSRDDLANNITKIIVMERWKE